MMKPKRLSDWLLAFYLFAMISPALTFGETPDGGAYAQLQQAAQPKPAAVQADETAPVTKPLASVSTGEMCTLRKAKPTKAQKERIQAMMKQIMARYGKTWNGSTVISESKTRAPAAKHPQPAAVPKPAKPASGPIPNS
jgi:hypothetical protein